ncbi:MAG: UDP-N-acetylmuramoyl-L-alanyl-D-glutamate--2,6-diaminopimelate ligase [Treponema sp.]|jgi:UDP-N-acetylmuramoyl-L-alanyl-D-glutamate--2,6-diaminopimelate ligase|nr:UDP-N-acetylmuramoyl-L-alanyl-D-glutamate--2,6-diaminopimelate ligase [Treponema sp.]
MERRLSEFARETAFVRGENGGDPFLEDPLVTGMAYDSRAVKPGGCFFAVRGLHTDGHDFIANAVERGASVVVHDREIPEGLRRGALFIRVPDSRLAMAPLSAAFYGHPSRRLIVTGVTGTEGKSTTVYLIYQFLRLLGKKAGFFSTVCYSLGDTALGGEKPNPEHQTTPEAPEVQRLLFEMAENGAEYAVVEASSHGLSKKTGRLACVDFDAAVITNVAHEHLEFHGTWEQYRSDKANLFHSLDRAREGSGTGPLLEESFGVINADDKSADYFAGATERRTFTYSVEGRDADLSLMAIESSPWGNWYEVLIRSEGTVTDIRDQLPGAFNAGNVLAALLAVSRLLSIPVREIIPLAARLKPVRGRMTAVSRGQPFEVLVDYAHTPSSFTAVFPPFRERLDKTGGRIISLFGSAGERDTKKRSEQGRIASDYSDIIILADEDPRGEVPMDILEEIAAGVHGHARGEDLFLIPDRPLAIRKALSLAREGDIVLLLGKGHENSIIYADSPVPYDEIGETEKALEELFPRHRKHSSS